MDARHTRPHIEDSDMLQEVVYGLSHDMGTPVRVISQFIKLLEPQIAQKLNDKEAYWLSLIQQNSLQLQEMLNALLKYSRLSTQDELTKSIDLNHIIDAVMSILVNQYPEHKIEVERDTLPQISAKPGQVYEVLFQLLDNAIKYSKANHARIAIRGHRQDKHCHLCLIDHGIGIAESQLAFVTRPFMRAVAPADYPGMGMGLAYVKRIAHLNQDSFSIAPNKGEGTQINYAFKMAKEG